MSMCSIDYDIKVPDATLVNVDIGSGDITLGGALARVSASSGSGDIDAKSLATPTLLAKTGSGDLDLNLAQAPTTATVKTGSGDVNVQVPRGEAYAVNVTTGSGDQDVTVDRVAGSTHTITAETGALKPCASRMTRAGHPPRFSASTTGRTRSAGPLNGLAASGGNQ